nr:hypothetical protein BaRGS_026222 [Batillaria attramentaria]
MSQQLGEVRAEVQALKSENQQQAQALQEAKSSVYVRWGRSVCPSSNEVVYTGVVGGAHEDSSGSATNYLCLTLSPVYSSRPVPSEYALLYGGEYQTHDSHYQKDPLGWGGGIEGGGGGGAEQCRRETPFGQLPCLVYKDKRYGQSSAIASFLAREFGLYGKSNLDSLRIDEVMNLVSDMGQAMAKARFESDEAKKVTLADLAVFDITETVNKTKADATAAFPLLQKLCKNVAEHPNVKKYLATRKDTPF